MKEKINNLINNIKKHYVISISLLALIAIIITLVLYSSNNESFAIEEETDSVTITCPETASAGQEVECSITANMVTITALSVNANYSVTEGLTYGSFATDSECTGSYCWTIYAQSENGFAVGNTTGITGSSLVGKIKYTIPETAASNQIYTITLTNVELSDDNFEMIYLDDVSSDIRILSNINTLNDITLTDGTINEAIAQDRTSYTATVAAATTTLSVVKTDEKSSVEGDIGNLSLHYGTNNFNINVTSESGETKKYTIAIYRPYKFTCDNYIYSEADNYIYTAGDVDSTTILSNITLPSELTSKIENNKLIISYGEEVLLEINIINIKCDDYTIINNIIYIGKDLSYTDLLNKITKNGVSIKIYNAGDTEITSGTIAKDYKLKVFYNDTLLEEYVINEEYVNISNLNVDDTNKIVKRIVLNTTYKTVIDNISTSGKITIKDKSNNTLSSSDKVKTGDVIEIKLSATTYKYTVSVLGDITGSGSVNVGDVAKLYRYLKGKDELEKYYVDAGDILNDGSIKVNDVSRLYRFIKGKVVNLEVE